MTTKLLQPRLLAAIDTRSASIRQLMQGRLVDDEPGVRAHLDLHNPAEEDDAQADAQSDLDAALLERYHEELRVLEAARARIVAGEFGVCLECGAAVPEARLLAAPESPWCVECQSRAEAGAHRPTL
ncbi:MAG: TraR/DksA family transcriptional regulator [Burkholderiales bacterium]|nr:TraR/DksA family transcriptional regulator [Burkholderiales bacterium]